MKKKSVVDKSIVKGASSPRRTTKAKPTSPKVIRVKQKVSAELSLAFAAAVANVAKLGDTDIFPRPFENSIFYDDQKKIESLLAEIHVNFEEMLRDMPPTNDRVLAAVGYNGFRLATQVDPIWNLYLLGQVLWIANDIESARVQSAKQVVFSYRYNGDLLNPQIFTDQIGWKQFNDKCVEHSKNYKYVLQTDISDFYPRVYHHRLENALKKATKNTEAIRRIKGLLDAFSGNVSYGLPVGGPASRLLSELVINSIDRLLLANGVTYCRFVDDFRIFADSREQAHAHLVLLGQMLSENEGLFLQKSKTRILSTEEFLSTSEFHEERVQDEDDAKGVRAFLSLSLHYDPYSENAAQDYEALRDQLERFDIVGMLARELKKSQIDERLTRKLIRAMQHIPEKSRDAAALSLSQNLDVLSPVFRTVMTVLRSIMSELSDGTKMKIYDALKALFRSNSHVLQIPVNQAYAIRLLATANDEEVDQILFSVYKKAESIGIKRDVILLMANRDAAWFVSDIRRKYAVLTPWEKRAALVSSFILQDEGRHWRDKVKNSLSPFDKVVMEWTAKRKNDTNGKLNIPL